MQLINTVSDALKVRKQAEALIKERRSQFSQLLECSNDFIWSIDLEGKFSYLSPQFQDIFGWEETAWLGKSMIDLIHVGDRPRFKRIINQVIDSQQRKELPVKFRHHKSDGSCIWVSCSINPVKNALGDVVGIQGLIRDISDRIALAYAIRDRKLAKVRLQELNRTLTSVHRDLAKTNCVRDKFFTDMSYELRTSLSVILGFVEKLQDEAYGSLNEKKVKASQTLENSETHLLKLINEILDFSQADIGCF
jgi:PAS domain S-box-containing protein